MTIKTIFKKIFFLFCTGVLFSTNTNAQCCAGGSGCSITGEASTGVLQERQVELSSNFQFVNTDKFYKKNKTAADSVRTFDSFNSSYQHFKIGYGITRRFTFSLEAGYYFKKKETGLDHDPATTYESKGIGDLILFPRYNIFKNKSGNHHYEITIGTGYKIPLGSYNDSAGNIEPFSGQTYFVNKPTSVQLSSGAQDIIFYTFLYHGWTKQNFQMFANAYYIKKGYNPNGEKSGDFTSVALFTGKSFFNHLGIVLQTRYEWADRMKINNNILLFGKPSNYFPEATGYKRVFFSPQVSYTLGKLTFFATSDFPVYQYLNTSDYYTQVGSKHQTTAGLIFRFFAVKNLNTSSIYYCPMHPDITSASTGQCTKCGMDLEMMK